MQQLQLIETKNVTRTNMLRAHHRVHCGEKVCVCNSCPAVVAERYRSYSLFLDLVVARSSEQCQDQDNTCLIRPNIYSGVLASAPLR